MFLNTLISFVNFDVNVFSVSVIYYLYNMNTNSAHKLFSVTLALLVLLSAFTFSVETRQCGFKFSDSIAVSKTKPCCNHLLDSSYELLEKDCCTGKIISVDGLNKVELFSSSSELPREILFEYFLRLESLLSFNNLQTTQSVIHTHYNPPSIIFERQIEYQSFLI